MDNNFLTNFRSLRKDSILSPKNNIEENLKTQRRENFERLERDLAAGKIKNTEEYNKKKYNTLVKMDNIYRLLANEFQDRFYEKHYNKEEKKWNKVSDKEILEESNDFLDEVIKNRGLDKEEFDNGKTFIENFREYNYNKKLLPDIDKKSDYSTGVRKYIFDIKPSSSPNTISKKERLL